MVWLFRLPPMGGRVCRDSAQRIWCASTAALSRQASARCSVLGRPCLPKPWTGQMGCPRWVRLLCALTTRFAYRSCCFNITSRERKREVTQAPLHEQPPASGDGTAVCRRNQGTTGAEPQARPRPPAGGDRRRNRAERSRPTRGRGGDQSHKRTNTAPSRGGPGTTHKGPGGKPAKHTRAQAAATQHPNTPTTETQPWKATRLQQRSTRHTKERRPTPPRRGNKGLATQPTTCPGLGASL